MKDWPGLWDTMAALAIVFIIYLVAVEFVFTMVEEGGHTDATRTYQP
jgi:hypothetical protein